MYQLQKQTITKIKRAFKNRSPNPFQWEELEAERNKKHKTPKPKHPENLWIDVYQDLKIKTDLVTWMKENGLSITPMKIDSRFTPLTQLLKSLDLHWQDFIWDKLKEIDIYLPKKLMEWYDRIKKFKDDFDTFIVGTMLMDHDGKNDWTKFNEFNDVIHNYCYDFHWTVDMGEYVGTAKELEAYKLIDDYLSSFILMMDQNTVVKNFLIKVEEKTKKSYIITNSNQKDCEIKQGENFKIMKSVNGKNKTERMLNKPLKYMGLIVTDSSSNKHMYAEVQAGDFNKYAYFMVYEEPIKFNQTLSNGKTISKYCFHLDNFDDGKGHDAIFVPSWMSLEIVNNDVTDKVGYLVAFEKNQWNNPIIAKIDALGAGCDSIKVLTAETIKGLKYHY